MGDVGYLDDQQRFWYCGRKSHRVQLKHQTLFTEPCESLINRHPSVYRSALVGVGEMPQIPVVLVEPWPEHRPANAREIQRLVSELLSICQASEVTRDIQHVFVYPDKLPTDIRHNSKIFREKLVPWATQQLRQEAQA